jgi:host cell surface-exposed lipoprotein/uncharacterized protein DUF2510
MSTSSPPPGWYPDPSGGPSQRYWDGTRWTDAFQPAAPEQPTATQPASSSAATSAQAAWYDQTWVLVLSLLFCFPIGLVLLWRRPTLKRGAKIGITVAIGLLAILGGVASATSNPSKPTSSSTVAPTTVAPTTVAPTTVAPTTVEPTTAAPATAPPTPAPTAAPTTKAPTPTAPPAPVETAGQANARRSAEQYLSLGSGFSRAGLIEQLSSSFGAGFSLADATYGVDATHTDWNAQACLSAKEYLKISAFSHAGLFEQLSSSFGGKFTAAEAEYGVSCAGL